MVLAHATAKPSEPYSVLIDAFVNWAFDVNLFETNSATSFVEVTIIVASTPSDFRDINPWSFSINNNASSSRSWSNSAINNNDFQRIKVNIICGAASICYQQIATD